MRIPLRARDGSVRAYAIVDAEDFERFGQLRWSLHSQGYAYRNVGKPRRNVLLHRAIMGLEYGDRREVDHENRDRLDCRRENLRVVTGAANRQNVASRGKGSRFRGVARWRGTRWQATGRAGGRSVWLGVHENELDAARAAEAFRRERMPFALPDPELEALGC